jgi:hypothetical protein
MTAPMPERGLSIPLADLSDTEKLDLIGGAAQSYDYENRPRDRNWTAVPLDQVGRLITGALRSLEFEPAALDAAEADRLRKLLHGARAHLGWIWRESGDENARQRANQALTELKEAGIE